MSRVAYTVIAHLPSDSIAREYVAWLEDGHVDAVIEHGAHSGMIVRRDPAPGDPTMIVETRYVFSTRELFEKYLNEFAPALRAEGLKRFGPERGVRFDRTIGVIL